TGTGSSPMSSGTPDEDITKTRSLTSTITNVITVYPVKSSSVPSGTGINDVAASSSAPAPYGTGISPANAEGTCEAKTVTETATETVTVTATPSASASGNVVKPVSLSSSVYYPTG